MIVTFIGHRVIYGCELLAKKLEESIKKEIKCDEFCYFYCGGYGMFDNLCTEICRKLKKEHKNIEIIYITPYLTESQQKNINCFLEQKQYDSVIYPPIENVPPKFAIIKRNEWMIDNADIIFSYVKHSFGGAYKSLNYAKRKKKTIINLAE